MCRIASKIEIVFKCIHMYNYKTVVMKFHDGGKVVYREELE